MKRSLAKIGNGSRKPPQSPDKWGWVWEVLIFLAIQLLLCLAAARRGY